VVPPSGSDDHRAGVHVFKSERIERREKDGTKREKFFQLRMSLRFIIFAIFRFTPRTPIATMRTPFPFLVESCFFGRIGPWVLGPGNRSSLLSHKICCCCTPFTVDTPYLFFCETNFFFCRFRFRFSFACSLFLVLFV
jgi:hypothetical protein